MKIKLGQIVAGKAALDKINSYDLPINVGLALVKNVKELETVTSLFQRKHQTLLDQFGTKSKDDKGYTIPAENTAAFNEAFNELMEHEVTTDFVTIKSDSLPPELTLSLIELASVAWLLEGNEEDS